MQTHNIQRHQPQPIGQGPHQGPMELGTLTKYLARAHNNTCAYAAQWGRKEFSGYLEAWNWCNAIAAGSTTASPSWLAQRAISRTVEICSIDFV